ncbi:S-layer homology domain-containing protein [Paenibacillus soyae]|uniref:S-layer homology domain-containing protein n=1 Tax=Paenibacillus soyae TaxID=2969249 RepID=A0A9X2S7Y6_9BACL|nr:S-layer homology domain-containing protein [Paenibacillus soyae]MCR2803645.1 S-layer homology domain-containing protein [Paenibacillus soyae]
MKKKSWLMIALTFVLLFTLGQSVMAFSDVDKGSDKEKIEVLKEKGIVNGISKDHFNPKGTLTYAAGISMIVKGLDLNIDHVRFIRMPLASDNHPNLKDDAWYSQAFVIADFYGLDIPKDVKPNDKMTKEQFAHHLFKAMMTKGEYAFIELFVVINDEADVNPAYMDSVQKLLITKIASLDKKNNFYPTQSITRGEAAVWLHDGMKFVEETPTVEPQPELPVFEQTLSVEAVNSDVNKVTITAQMPHPGYGLRIASISFEGDKAVIYTEAVEPDPDKMYPQVITEVKVSTYVDAKFKPVLPETGGGSDASVGIEEAIAG